MEEINFDKHYEAFKWAVSKYWKDKNGLFYLIQYKINVLEEKYNLSIQDITSDLFSHYWERGHYKKYDETKGSLNNWIARYVNLYLNNLIRKYAVREKNNLNQRIDPLDERNQANILWLDKNNESEDEDYQPEFMFDLTNPENLLIAKQTVDFAKGHFAKSEIEYMEGEIDLTEAASMSGTTCEAFRKRLDRKKIDFKQALSLLEPR
jgi:hypothetical protein